LNDFLYEGQPNSTSIGEFFVGASVKRSEYFIQFFGFHAYSLVLKADTGNASGGSNRNPAGMVLGKFAGIFHEIGKRNIKEIGITADGDFLFFKIQYNLIIFGHLQPKECWQISLFKRFSFST